MMNNFTLVKKALACREQTLVPGGNETRAAVAMILREKPAGLEVLFIERAPHDNDPWSGHIGFPGGKVEDIDESPRMTAERETLEEIGLDLKEARYLGFLSEIAAETLPVRLSCFVYGIERPGPLSLSGEVKDVFWAPLGELLDPENHGDSVVGFAGRTFTRPSIRFPEAGKPVLWGITYRLVMQFLGLLQSLGTD